MEGSVKDMQHLGDVASPSWSNPASLPVLESVSKYEKLQRIGEGTYGVVCECPRQAAQLSACCTSEDLHVSADKARDRSTGEVVALKKVRMDRERDGEPAVTCRGTCQT